MEMDNVPEKYALSTKVNIFSYTTIFTKSSTSYIFVINGWFNAITIPETIIKKVKAQTVWVLTLSSKVFQITITMFLSWKV